MTDCELIVRCAFFNDQMKNMPATADILKDKFCKTDYMDCARYMVFKSLGKENVPFDLFPQQSEKARKIIKED